MGNREKRRNMIGNNNDNCKIVSTIIIKGVLATSTIKLLKSTKIFVTIA